MPQQHLTDRQTKWFASVREGLERDTGKSMTQWIEIARACPETTHRARLRWFKETHGLLQNRASQVLSEAFPSTMAWQNSEALLESLWGDPTCRAIYERIDVEAMALEGTLRTPRKGFTAWARKVQFAAIRPIRGGGAMVGLAVSPDSMPGLRPRGSESWSERLQAKMELSTNSRVDAALVEALRNAWQAA
jgi:hypothetical protein